MARKKKAKKVQDDTSQLQENEKAKQLPVECDEGKKRQTPERCVTEPLGANEPVVDLTVKTVKGQQKASDRMQNIVSKLSEQSKKSGFRDGRLLGRMKEYLSGLTNKNFVSIPLMAEHLQNKYHEYRRKKKGPFVQYVDRAYFSMEKGTTARVKDEMGGEISSDSSEEGEDDEELVEYKDTNAMNSMMSSLYKNSPAHSSEGKRRNADSPARDLKRPKVTDETSKAERVIYASPDALSRNLNSTGLVGPRRSAKDKYFIDRTGDNSSENEKREDTKGTKVSSSREANIKEFLSGLPSRTSFSSYVNSKQDPRLKSGTLYRVYQSSEEGDNVKMQAHSGITKDNEGVSRDPPLSPGDKGSAAEDGRGAGDAEGQDKGSSGRNEPEPQTKGERSRSKAGKKGKDGSRSKKTTDSETEDTKSDKGPTVQKSSVTFADVGGNDATLTDICKLLVHMRHPEVYNQLGITPPRGFLLHGPPGCGKTLLANAIAGELELPLLKIAATEIVSGVSGDSEQKVRQLFDKAVQSAPCVVFIDEIDSITPKRETASKDMERRIVAQLLSCMDDLSASTEAHVLVIGATNRPDSLDPALRRAGRFDREICLGIPDEPARRKILEVLCRPLRLIERFDFGYLAHNTPGFVGADLMALSREAAMVAVNRAFQKIQLQISTSKGDKCVAMETDTSDNVTSSKDNVANSIPSDANIPSQTNNSKKMNGEETTASSDPCSVIRGDTEGADAVNTTDLVDSKGANTVADVQGDNDSCSNNPCDSASGDKPEDATVKSCDSLDTECMDTTTKCDSGISETCPESKSENQVEDCDSKQKRNNSEEERDCSSTSMQNTMQLEKSTAKEDLFSVLSWLKEQPPLTEDQLRDLYITLDDFKEALQFVQPSAKREGFATIPDVSWDDIGALQDVREELQLAVLAPVRHAEEFKSLGLNRAQGVLLAGPPGCGKTLLAKAVANESGINFISVKGPELLNMYVGESEKAVRTVFQRARNSAPCVIFFDELDALCPRRSGSAEGGSSARVVNQLLTEMDGLEERKQVFIMAATNRPDIIDPAILRPGRLDKTLYVGLPTQADRKDIFTCITKNGTKPLLADNVDLAELAVDTRCDGYTGADLAALVREASVVALREAIMNKGRQPGATITVTRGHFETAFTKIRPSVSAKDQEKYKSMRQALNQPTPGS